MNKCDFCNEYLDYRVLENPCVECEKRERENKNA